jgi:glutaminyl-peptide cyclotransferase
MLGRRLDIFLAPMLLALVISTGGCSEAAATPVLGGPPAPLEKRSFDGGRAYQYALDQCEIGPRPPGSDAGWATGEYILAKLKNLGWQTKTQEFEYRGVSLRNIIGKRGSGPVVILGAHYDTRPVADRDPQHADQPIVGGNDGASGVAVLLELADVLAQHELENEVWLAFFDAEDSGRLEGWPFAVGSAYMAENLTVRPECVIVVDMVGDRDQKLYYEGNSDPALRERLWAIAADLGYRQFVPEVGYTLVDDHVPFVNGGIPAVDIIDFRYHYWHTVQDTCDKIGAGSLERVGRVLEAFVLSEG